MADHQFKPGTVVAIIESRWGPARPSRAVVAKVHKTGRFTLAGSPAQWAAWRDGVTAYQASRDVWNRATCEIWSPKHDDMLVQAGLLDRWRKATKAISDARATPTAEMVEAAERLAALFAKPLASTPESPHV